VRDGDGRRFVGSGKRRRDRAMLLLDAACEGEGIVYYDPDGRDVVNVVAVIIWSIIEASRGGVAIVVIGVQDTI